MWTPFSLVLVLVLSACGDDTSAPADAGRDSELDAQDVGVDVPVEPHLTMNDVSILIPLPGRGEPGLLAADAQGARGLLLPQQVFDEIPSFPVITRDRLQYNIMRTMAIRFDGCHRRQASDPCQAQIRMVMQPLSAITGTADSAIHLFYELSDSEFQTVIDELLAMRDVAPQTAVEGPLRLHPVLVEQGHTGTYAARLTDLILRNCGEENLIQATFFLRAPPAREVWFFGGFTRTEGELAPLPIVGVENGVQRVIRTELSSGYNFLLTPEALEPEDGSPLFTSGAAEAATDEERRAAFGSFLRVENPAIHTVDDLPCAGCHIATFVTAASRETFGFNDSEFSSDVYSTEDHDLTLTTESRRTPSSLRAFGFFEREPMIAQRTVNETSMVLFDIEARF